jgi:nucleotide-binding universal stress UspA family protein
MTYKTLMVELSVGESNKQRLEIAASLAHSLNAAVIGIAGCQPMAMAYGDGYYSGEAVQDDRDELDVEIKAAEAEFRCAFSETAYGGSSTSPGWHAAVVFETIAQYVSRRASGADLIITGHSVNTSPRSTRSADIGDLIMEAGRPVLVLPPGATTLSLQRVLIAWKDSREARRAIVDALPLLKRAEHVVLAQFVKRADIDLETERMSHVGRWLEQHDVHAELMTFPSVGEDPTSLYNLIEEQHVGLVVAGAYGHSRFQEWVLGGVTRDLLLHQSHCSLLSH